MYGAPLNFVPCLLAQSALSFVPLDSNSLGITVNPRRVPVKPAFFEKLLSSIAQVFAPSHS